MRFSRICALGLALAGAGLDVSAAWGQEVSTGESSLSCNELQGCAVSGVVIVPGKLELTGNHDVLGSAMVGPFGGYRFGTGSGDFMSHISFIGFFGFVQNVGGTSVSGSAAGSGSSQPGVSYGLGASYALSPTLSNTSLDLVLGFDHLADSLHYPYNDKPWISAGVGFGF